MGRTNMLKNILHHLSGQKIYLFDNKSGDLLGYSNQENLTYAGNAEAALALVEELKVEIEKRTVDYEANSDNSLTLKAYGQTLEPIFILIDVVQELNETLEKVEHIDVFVQAVQCGMYVIVTADAKLRARREEFLALLLESKHGLVVGNIKEQGVFSFTGIREENRKVDLGYYHFRGENQKIKLIEYSN